MALSSRAVPAARPRPIILASLALLSALGAPAGADARDKPRECKPAGVPVALGASGAIEMAEPVGYSDETRILAADKAIKPSKLRLISASGEAVDLPNPPWTMEPSRWLSRGHAVYAVGTGRSQTPGKIDVVLVRWGMDSRPRLTKVATLDHVASPPRAALINEFMAVMWAEQGADGKPHARASFFDVEELKIHDPIDLGASTEGGFVELVSAGKGFVALWSTSKGLMRAAFDMRGKSSAAAAALDWKDGSEVRSAISCDERLWLVHSDGPGKLAVSTSDPSGPMHRVASLAASEGDHASMLCAQDSAVVAHRVINEKAGNVVLWLTTIEPSGKTHERRVKDVAGTADTIRMAALAGAGETRSAFWVEGGGEDAKLWSRAITCD